MEKVERSRGTEHDLLFVFSGVVRFSSLRLRQVVAFPCCRLFVWGVQGLEPMGRVL